MNSLANVVQETSLFSRYSVACMIGMCFNYLINSNSVLWKEALVTLAKKAEFV